MKKKLNYKDIGSRIRFERENLNLSREKFAEFVGISPYYLGQIERGDRRMSLEVLIKIALLLHVSVDYILFGKGNYLSDTFSDLECTARESSSYYKTNGSNNKNLEELMRLLSRCSDREISLIKELATLIIPYIKS